VSRGRSRRTLDLIEASHEILAEIQPATVRAVCYKLFVAKLIASMAKKETNKISRLLRIARENNEIPWEWIVDETRSLERCGMWSQPDQFARSVISAYRKDYWALQPIRVEVWSEKGTVRGTLAPILDKYGVGFRVMHGYSSATAAYDVAQEIEWSLVPFVALYVGDRDPSGMYMSGEDLPRRLAKYGAEDPVLERIAITAEDANSGLPHFDAEEKRKDPRYSWYVKHYGHRCWELDALDPNCLRDRVEQAIRAEIDFEAWDRCKTVEEAERQSLVEVMKSWGRDGGVVARTAHFSRRAPLPRAPR
jgi:hypothetical protein